MNVVRRLFRCFTLLVLYSLAAQMTSMNGNNATSVEARHGDLTRESVKAWLSNISSVGVFSFVEARSQIIAHAARVGIQEGDIDAQPRILRAAKTPTILAERTYITFRSTQSNTIQCKHSAQPKECTCKHKATSLSAKGQRTMPR